MKINLFGKVFVVLVAVCAAWLPVLSFAVMSGKTIWIKDGIPVYNDNNQQWFTRIITDNNEGNYVCFIGEIAATHETSLYLTRIDKKGIPVWPSPVLIASDPKGNLDDFFKLIPDGLGGAIVSWRKLKAAGGGLYAQRVNQTGEKLWGADGKQITLLNGYSSPYNAVSANSGGVIITWADNYGDPGKNKDYDIYVQGINPDGTLVYTTGAKKIHSEGSLKNSLNIVKSGDNVFVSWIEDYESFDSLNAEIYVQKLNTKCEPQWAEAKSVNTIPSRKDYLTVTQDGNNGVIFTWVDSSGIPPFGDWADEQIIAQKIDNNGEIQWGVDGILVCNAPRAKYFLNICSDNNKGAYIVWQDMRNHEYSFYPNGDIYAQRIDKDGNTLWVVDGISVFAGESNNIPSELITDTFGRAVIIGTRSTGPSPSGDIYGYLVNNDGSLEWDPNGVPICTAKEVQARPGAVLDTKNYNVVIAWEDWRQSTYAGADGDIYVQRISVEAPPTVEIFTNKSSYYVGENITVTLKGHSYIGLKAVWWWIVGVGGAHWNACNGENNVVKTNVIKINNPGIYSLKANARDILYPKTGQSHQASEGKGIPQVIIEVKNKV